MAEKLAWTSIALQDLEDIFQRICNLGDEREAAEQLSFIYQEVERLPDFPRKFPVYAELGQPGVREFKFTVYHVIYRVEKSGQVLILSVFHTQRDVQQQMKKRKRHFT